MQNAYMQRQRFQKLGREEGREESGEREWKKERDLLSVYCLNISITLDISHDLIYTHHVLSKVAYTFL